MTRGRVALWAESQIEIQVIKNFLLAADYQVVNYYSLAHDDGVKKPDRIDAGVIVHERFRSDLRRVIRAMKERIGKDVPIIAVVQDPPVERDDSVRFLLRPIKLFELTGATEKAIRARRVKERGQSKVQDGIRGR